jgi:pimeloyl-ACP methyl ester carboxylesterase
MEKILNVTGNQKMFYAGHSMGTTQYFIAMSQRPELNSQIETAFLLAPIAYMFHATNIVRLLSPLGYNAQACEIPYHQINRIN